MQKHELLTLVNTLPDGPVDVEQLLTLIDNQLGTEQHPENDPHLPVVQERVLAYEANPSAVKFIPHEVVMRDIDKLIESYAK